MRLVLAFLSMVVVVTAEAATTVDAVHRYAYGANLGWADAYADGPNGAVIGDYTCAGYVYFANVGWVNLGNGSPTNGIRYQNLSSSDFGVNHDGFGNLRGYAWGANIGWLNFENTGAPTVDLRTGRLSGYVWSANCGWLSLSNAFAYVQTDSFWPGNLDINGLPIPWEMTYFGTTGVDPNADPDHDGMSNLEEYLGGTAPTNGSDFLHITSWNSSSGGTAVTLSWSSVLNRLYHIEETLNLVSPAWYESSLGLIYPDGASTTRTLTDTNAPTRFYRIKAVRPLAP